MSVLRNPRHLVRLLSLLRRVSSWLTLNSRRICRRSFKIPTINGALTAKWTYQPMQLYSSAHLSARLAPKTSSNFSTGSPPGPKKCLESIGTIISYCIWQRDVGEIDRFTCFFRNTHWKVQQFEKSTNLRFSSGIVKSIEVSATAYFSMSQNLRKHGVRHGGAPRKKRRKNG